MDMTRALSLQHNDRLTEMFYLREAFMRALRDSKPGTYPDSWPIDMSLKSSQQLCRDLIRCGVEELFEATQHFRNAKAHRSTDVSEFDRQAFLEEVVDGLNYVLSPLVLMGFTADDLFAMYVQKDGIINERLVSGY